VLVAGAVIDERTLASRVLDVALGQLLARSASRLPGELEDVEGRARVASCPERDQGDELVRDAGAELVGSATDDRRQLVLGERL
jgi:hypothetical protein